MKISVATAVVIVGAGCPKKAAGFLLSTPKISQVSSMLRSVSTDGTSASERRSVASRARGSRGLQMKSQATQVKTDVSQLASLIPICLPS